MAFQLCLRNAVSSVVSGLGKQSRWTFQHVTTILKTFLVLAIFIIFCGSIEWLGIAMRDAYFAMSDREYQYLLLSLKSCQKRVQTTQADLFSPKVYFARPRFGVKVGDEAIFYKSLSSLGFHGNPDLYGLGVRLGLYLQWGTFVVANHLLPQTPTKLLQAFFVVCFAFYCALMMMTIQKSCNFSIEVIIIQQMLVHGLAAAGLRPYTFWASKPKRFQGFSWLWVTERILLALTFSHIAWFWMFGFDRSIPSMPYGTKLFYFGSLDQNAIYRSETFYVAFAFFMAVFQAIILLLAVLFYGKDVTNKIKGSNIYRALRPTQRQILPSDAKDTSLKVQTPGTFTERLRRFQKSLRELVGLLSDLEDENKYLKPWSRLVCAILMSACSLGTMVHGVAAVELTIRWNNISDVSRLDSAGQYIPLTVGLTTFVVFLYELLKHQSVSLSSLLVTSY